MGSIITKHYPISFEIAGPAAIFVRPDSGSVPVTYPAPTRSALKGMAECIVYSKDAYFLPQAVEICSPICYHDYATTYHGPLKKSGTSVYQLFATTLEDVCYKVYGEVLAYRPPRHKDNPQHAFQAVFQRRLKRGEFHTTPFLGWKEFAASYMGLLREETSADESINLTIPSMLADMYDRPTMGRVSPRFLYNVKIEKGVLRFAE